MSEGHPADFSLVLEWGTGSLPPMYRYQYSIAISPGPQGEFANQPGYGEFSEGSWITPFDVDDADLQSLYEFMKSNNVLRKRWRPGMPLVGGQSTNLIITAFGQQYLVPSISEVSQNKRELIERTIIKIKSHVPGAVWTGMDSRQADFEQNYPN